MSIVTSFPTRAISAAESCLRHHIATHSRRHTAPSAILSVGGRRRMPEPPASHPETGEAMTDEIALNMGIVDRAARGLFAVLLMVLPPMLGWPRPVVVGLAGFAGLQTAAVAIGHCVTYPWLGVSTRRPDTWWRRWANQTPTRPKNIGTADRVVRFGLGGALLGFASAYSGPPVLLVLMAWLGGAVLYEAVVEY